MNRRSAVSLFTILLASTFFALTLSTPASAQEEQPSTTDVRVVRLSFVQGDVQYQRPDQDWQDASVNLPIQQGFRLATTDGRAEVQFESGLILRLAENSILEFTQLDTLNFGRITKLNLTQGTMIATADLRPTDLFSVDAPNVHVMVLQPTHFRIDTTQGDSWVGVFAGDVLVKTETGETKVTNGHTFHISGADINQVSIDMNAAADDFDKWAADRDRSITVGTREATQYVSGYTTDYSDYNYGMSDLSSYGHWVVVAGAGLCWEPYGVPDHWRPFFNGSWEFFPRTGWTWVSFEPWGWLPFHTGHWFPRPVGVGWVWQPGQIRKWHPAPVHWFKVGNQIGWSPAGTLNSHGQPPAKGIVIGTREEHGLKIRPGVREPLPSEMIGKITPLKLPAPLERPQGTHEGSTGEILPPARPENFPPDGAIRLDPATRTYVNSHPQGMPVTPVRPGISLNLIKDAPTERDTPDTVRPVQPTGVVPQIRPVQQPPATKPTGMERPPVPTSPANIPPAHNPLPPQPTQIQRPGYVMPAHPEQPAPQPHYTPPVQQAPHNPPPQQPPAQQHTPPPPAPAATPHTPPPAPAAPSGAPPIKH